MEVTTKLSNKAAVVKVLETARKRGCKTAIITCDISHTSNYEVCYPNERILVLLDPTMYREEYIGKGFYTICDDIDDFNDGIVYGSLAVKLSYGNYYVSRFLKVECK